MWRLTPLLLAFASLSSAQSRFTIEQVLSAPFASSPVPSPTGAKVAWLLNEQGRRNIWVASGPEWKARKLTAFNEDDGQEIADVAWTPDGRSLLFARGGDFENGGENPNPAYRTARPDQSIWTVSTEGGAATKLTEGQAPAPSPRGDTVAFLRGGQVFTMKPSGQDAARAIQEKGTASELRWSPDGESLAFVSRRRDHSFVAIYKPRSKELRYLDASTDFDAEVSWSPDGKSLAYIRTPSEPYRLREPRRAGPPWSIRIFSLTTGSAREVFRADPGPGSVFHPVVADSQLFWSAGSLLFPWEKDGWCHLYRIPATGGTPTLLTPGAGEVEHVAATSDGKKLYYSSNIQDTDRRHIWELDVTGGAARIVTAGTGIEWAPTPVADGSALFYLASGITDRAHAVVQPGSGKQISLATETVPNEYPASELVAPQAVELTAADGLKLHGQLFLPKGASGERHPALLFFHGGSRRQMVLGSHYMYYYSNAYAMNQFLASQGYVVLSVNYRSGIGYGLDFREALNYGVSGGSEFNDVMGAGLYLKARPDVDPARIGVWGGSYGGYLTAMALARASDLFAAGVDFHGVHDWSALLNGTVNTGDPARRRALEESLRIAFDSSPMASIDTWRSPVLLIHGDDDRNVAFSQSVILADSLRARNVSFEELIIPNEIHDFLLHRSWVEAYRATAEYFGRKLGTHPPAAMSRTATQQQ